ncbi:apoptotic chromatin condensation inducer in the nucleus-like isoform X3 [Solanum tuberosum]|uniref:apoptotic chromatin condensation inducer in the nucleus-like isoform X3 n=1 Tax=Solanum tuberosum TaxID=4113 RepID=UPI0003D27ACA|nr:PREDICTED: apoptotic chromatin condensation inducer in the nucleus-like isoform X3 [Solanum tuberosum]
MSDYPVLDNLPIDKWKVPALREELKRRNLMTKGLKDDLVNRLNNAIHRERGEPEVEESTEINPDVLEWNNKSMGHPQNKVIKGSDRDTDPANATKVLDEVATGGTDDVSGVREHSEASVGSTSVINEIVSTDQFVEVKIDKKHEVIDSSLNNDVVDEVSGVRYAAIQSSGTVQDIEDMRISSSEGVLEDNLRRQENDAELTPVTSKDALGNNSIKLEDEGLKLSGMDAEYDKSNPDTQVYEVNPDLGSQVKSDTFSTDTLPINENNDLNDNLNADNVKLVTEVVRQEKESSSKDLSDVGSIYPLHDQMPHEMQGHVGETVDDKSSEVKFSMKKANADQVSVAVTKVEHGLESNTLNNSEQKDVQFEKARTLGDVIDPSLSPKKVEVSAEDKHCIAASNDDRKVLSKISEVADDQNMEKINLDQSSADDSMEEDVVETKHVAFDHISKENDKTEESITGMTKEPKVVRNGSSDATQQDNPSEKVESPQESKDGSPELSEKRKFQVGDGSKEPAKRQRKWNTENLNTAEPQNSNIALSENLVQTIPVKPIFGRTDSTVSEDAPKERLVPKSSKTATNSLKIENFLRPFTLKAVQELLARTGEVCSFWMDQIKTHCYVTYSSVEEAIETRNAVYNLQWPPKGGRLLVADFVAPQQVQTKIDGREPATPATNRSPAVPPASSSVQAPPAWQQVESEHPLTRQAPPAPPTAPPIKEKLVPPVADKNDPPVITLDDIFRKTKAAPRIYYLPLTDEEVAKKLASRGGAEN